MTEEKTAEYMAKKLTLSIELDISDWINEVQFGLLPSEVHAMICEMILSIPEVTPLGVLKFIFNKNVSDNTLKTCMYRLSMHAEASGDKEFNAWFKSELIQIIMDDDYSVACSALQYYHMLKYNVKQEETPKPQDTELTRDQWNREEPSYDQVPSLSKEEQHIRDSLIKDLEVERDKLGAELAVEEDLDNIKWRMHPFSGLPLKNSY